MLYKERLTNIELHKHGIKSSEIVEANGYGWIKVDRAVKRFRDTGTSNWPSSTTTSKIVNNIRYRIHLPSELMRKMAKELRISVRNIIRSKLRLRSYKLNCCHFLNEAMKAKLLAKFRRMLRLVADGHLNKSSLAKCSRWDIRSSFREIPSLQANISPPGM